MDSKSHVAQFQRNIFAANLKRYMKLSGKEQSDLVKELGVTSSTVSDWVNAKKYPRVDKMQAIADSLGVLLSDLREEKKPTGISDDGLTEEQIILIKSLSRADRDMLLSLARQMKMREEQERK